MYWIFNDIVEEDRVTGKKKVEDQMLWFKENLAQYIIGKKLFSLSSLSILTDLVSLSSLNYTLIV